MPAKTRPLRALLPLWLCAALLLTTAALAVGRTWGRYATGRTGGDSARTARGVVTVSYAENDTDFVMNRPADDGVLERNFVFAVSNDVSEVAIRYDVTVILDQPLQAGVTLRLDGRTGSPGADQTTYTFSDMGTFAANVRETYHHTLTFAGDYGEIPAGTNDRYQITIAIRSQQID